MTPQRIAINSVSTRHDSLDDALEAYAAAGFRNVEFQMSGLKRWLADGHSVGEMRRLLDRLEVRCIGGFEAVVLAFADRQERAANEQLHIDNARLIAELGGGGVMVAGTDGPHDMDPFESLDVIGRAFAGLAERIDPSVSLALEFNWGPIVKSIRSARFVVDAADHPRVGILFDPAHYHCTTSKLEDLTADLAAKVIHVHVDDMADKPGEHSHCNSDRVLPGRGILDLLAIINRLEAHGYRGYFAIEMFNEQLWNMPVREAARQMYASMASLCDPDPTG